MISRLLSPVTPVLKPVVRPLLGPVLTGAANGGTALRVLVRSGVLRPLAPSKVLTLTRVLATWGTGPAGGFAAMAAIEPDREALVDELGGLTFAEVHRRANALARALAERGVVEGDAVAVMCRNHRGFVEASLAAARLGADVVFLNTAFAGPQVREALARDTPRVLVHDEEFSAVVDGAVADGSGVGVRLLAWTESDPDTSGRIGGTETLEALLGRHADADLTPPGRQARVVILTSGTTGRPRGAPRSEAGLGSAVALLSRMPLRFGMRVHVAAPLFHTWGFAHLMLAVLLGETVVLRRRFEPAECLRVAEDCQALVVIPVMLQRMLALPEAERAQVDLSALEVVAASGSALPGDLAVRWMDAYGDHLYNLYGSTEVAYASIATPEDLRAAPTSAGRPPHGTVVRVLDEHGQPLPPGRSGRIFVGNAMLFDGYTDGGGKETVDGLMATGDVGRFDVEGRLYVEGRDDEMIVSGGENVFPTEVEDCLARHGRVIEVAVVGVPDEDFGQRLRAFVVTTEPAPEAAELQDWVKEHLARYKVPRDVVFVDELPRTSTGKVLKRDLAESSWTPGETP